MIEAAIIAALVWLVVAHPSAAAAVAGVLLLCAGAAALPWRKR